MTHQICLYTGDPQLLDDLESKVDQAWHKGDDIDVGTSNRKWAERLFRVPLERDLVSVGSSS